MPEDKLTQPAFACTNLFRHVGPVPQETRTYERPFTEEDRIQRLKEVLEDPFWDFQHENILAVIRWYEEGGKLSRIPQWFMYGKLCDSKPELGKAIVWQEV